LATFTQSPVTMPWPVEESPATTSPVFTPVRTPRSTPQSCWSSTFSAAIDPRRSAAALTARSASSSCTVGLPKTAITESPMNFSTVPPWRFSTSEVASK